FSMKGIIHVPAHNTPLTPSRRQALLIAIAKARKWVDDLAHGRVANFAVIARHEGKGEQHVRRLAPLACLSPRIVSAVLEGTAAADLTLTALAHALPYAWAEQERRLLWHFSDDGAERSSSNRTGGFPASGFPTSFIVRLTAALPQARVAAAAPQACRR